MQPGRPPPHVARPRPEMVASPHYRSSPWGAGVPSSGNRSASRSRRPEPVQHIGKYRVIKTIGKGNFAVVKLAKHAPTGRMVAIKIIDKAQLSSSSLQKMCREVKVMKSLDHPNIVKLFEVMETNKTMYLVLEYVSGGEIFDHLVTKGRMKESDVRAKFRQIISAVHYCHQKNIVHRDLKAENLLLDRDMNIKIADFGFSNEFNVSGKLNTFCGSPPYAAPELFQGKKYIGPEVDVWSLGVILYTFVTGSLPFDGHNLKELKEKVLKGKYSVPFYVPSDCQRLLRKFLVLNPAKRITLEAAMKDRWLNEGYSGAELRPYTEPSRTIDDSRIESVIQLGYTRELIDQSLAQQRYDEVWAAYHLLALKAPAPTTPSTDSVFSRPVRRTASELPANKPAVSRTAGPRLALFVGGVTATLNEIPDDIDDDMLPVVSPGSPPRPRAAIDSDRSFIGNESASPIQGARHLSGLQNKPFVPVSSSTPTATVPPTHGANGFLPASSSMEGGAKRRLLVDPADRPQTATAVPSRTSTKPNISSSDTSSSTAESENEIPSPQHNIPLVTLTSSPTSKRRANARSAPPTPVSVLEDKYTPEKMEKLDMGNLSNGELTPEPLTPDSQRLLVQCSAPTRLLELRHVNHQGDSAGSRQQRPQQTNYTARVSPSIRSPAGDYTRTPTNPSRSASFNVARPVPVTNLTRKKLDNFPSIPEMLDTSDREAEEDIWSPRKQTDEVSSLEKQLDQISSPRQQTEDSSPQRKHRYEVISTRNQFAELLSPRKSTDEVLSPRTTQFPEITSVRKPSGEMLSPRSQFEEILSQRKQRDEVLSARSQPRDEVLSARSQLEEIISPRKPRDEVLSARSQFEEIPSPRRSRGEVLSARSQLEEIISPRSQNDNFMSSRTAGVIGVRLTPQLVHDNGRAARIGSARFRSFRVPTSTGVNSACSQQYDTAAIVGVAETAPNWHVKPIAPGRPSALHDSGYASASGSRFSRNVPLRQTVHGLPASASNQPAPPMQTQTPVPPPPPPVCSRPEPRAQSTRPSLHQPLSINPESTVSTPPQPSPASVQSNRSVFLAPVTKSTSTPQDSPRIPPAPAATPRCHDSMLPPPPLTPPMTPDTTGFVCGRKNTQNSFFSRLVGRIGRKRTTDTSHNPSSTNPAPEITTITTSDARVTSV